MDTQLDTPIFVRHFENMLRTIPGITVLPHMNEPTECRDGIRIYSDDFIKVHDDDMDAGTFEMRPSTDEENDICKSDLKK